MSYSKRTFTDAEREDICKSYRTARDPQKQISILAELYVCDKRSIEAVLQSANLWKCKAPAKKASPKRTRTGGARRAWSAEDISQLVEFKAKGMSNIEIAKHFNISASSVSSQVFKHKKEIEAYSTSVSNVCDNASSSYDDPTCAVELLQEFQRTFCDCINSAEPIDAYKIGVKIGQFSAKIDALLERLDRLVK